MIILWILSFLLFLCQISLCQSCVTSGLPGGVILSCHASGSQVAFHVAKNETIATDTECVVKTKNGAIRVRCDGTKWNIKTDDKEAGDYVVEYNEQKKGLSRKVRNVGDVLGEAAMCVLTLLSCLWSGRAGHVDRTPPSLVCDPALITVTAKPLEIYAYASWTEPTAQDEEDGYIKPRRKSGRPPGSHFPENDTRITYEAKDKSGNRAECTITVRVKIVRCNSPKKVENGYFQCSPVTDFLNGGRCRFGCYEGFDLAGGAEVIYCKTNGQWSGQQPVCKPFQCPSLDSVDRAGRPVCTNGSNFRSICVYNCAAGFDMPPKVSKAVVCDKSKSWRKFGEPKCVDVEAPMFTTCPSLVITGTDTGFNSTVVSWEEPTAKDNSNKSSVVLKQGVKPGDRLTVGTYSVQYEAMDDAGNIAHSDCKFSVIVREIRCSRLYETPFLRVKCPIGYRSGANCTLECYPGNSLIGQDTVECERSSENFVGTWNWKNGQQSFCKSNKGCVPLDPPKHGAVACDNWEGGKYCQIQCRNGTEMSGVSLKKLYVCDTETGKWSKDRPEVNACKGISGKKIQSTLGIEVSYYFYGDCNDPATKEQIANNFVAAILQHPQFQQGACPPSSACNPRNVEITCGESNQNTRNATGEKTPANILGVTFRIPFKFDANNISFSATKYDELISSVKDLLQRNEYEIFGNTTVAVKDFKSKGLEIHCPEGAVKSQQSWNCIECPEGTYYVSNSTLTACVACPKGFYQDDVAQKECKLCPNRKTTSSVGAESETECQETCAPGSFSNDGLLPCSPCEQGDYQPSYGQTSCKKCLGSKSTLTFGSASIYECKEFDIEFIPNETPKVDLILPKNESLEEFTLAFWFRSFVNDSRRSGSSITVELSDSEATTVWTWKNMYKVIWQDKMDTITDLKLSDSRWHLVMLYNGPACKIVVTLDGASLLIHESNDECSRIIFNKISVLTENTSSASISQFNIWKGKPSKKIKQKCFSDGVGNVLSWKQFEEAKLSGAYLRIPSQCDDFDSCMSSPCLHGSCTDTLNGFTCTCERGFVGTQCDVNKDDCDINICTNNSTCVDAVETYTCLCPPKYTGQYCEIAMVDGGWSEWSNWSECSTTCGHGQRSRKRLCNSPIPDNGGENCLGKELDNENCNNLDCPTCPPIRPPNNGSLECLNDTESINCTISCDEDFEFDIEPLPMYYCGPETFHEWNFQTDENPDRRLPECVATELPEVVKVQYTAYYRDLYCAAIGTEGYAPEAIEAATELVLSTVPCLLNRTCLLDFVNVISCNSEGKQKRAIETAGLSLQISNNSTIENKKEILDDLEKGFQYIQNATENGEFTLKILDKEYELDVNRTVISGEIICGPGQTRVGVYCVPCGSGSYLDTDVCKPCPIGTYQPLEGQTSCTDCPLGKSTIGILSTSKEDCNVVEVTTVSKKHEDSAIIAGSTSGVAVIVFISIVSIVYIRKRRKKVNYTVRADINLAFTSLEYMARHDDNEGSSALECESPPAMECESPPAIECESPPAMECEASSAKECEAFSVMKSEEPNPQL